MKLYKRNLGHVEKKPRTNGQWLVIGMVGDDCCRNPYQPCHNRCKVMWKIWIGCSAIFLLISGLTNLCIAFWRFHSLEDHPKVFVLTKMKRMLILSPNMVPGIYEILNLGGILVAMWTFTLIFVQCLRLPITYCLFRCFHNLLYLGLILLLVLEIVYGWGEWPDDLYMTSLEVRMMTDLRLQHSLNNVSKIWVDTQQAFRCCGVNTFQDWYSIPSGNPENALRILPPSCCDEATTNVGDFCYESLSTGWQERGCLLPQIADLKRNWLILTSSTTLLFISLGAITRAVLIFIVKFPVGRDSHRAGAGILLGDENIKKSSPSSSWERQPPPPRRPQKYKPFQQSDDDEKVREPLLLKSASAPEGINRSEDQGQDVGQPNTPEPITSKESLTFPETADTTFLYRSPTGAGNIGSAHSLQDMSSFHEPLTSSQTGGHGSPLTSPPPHAGDPPQIYFPTRTPSNESGRSQKTLKDAHVGTTRSTEKILDQLKRQSNEGDVTTKIFLGTSTKDDDAFMTPHHGSSVPLLLQLDNEKP